MIKILNIDNKERILNVTRRKDYMIYKGRLIRTTPNFSMETKSKRA